ncbi:hypothetical protein ABT324_20495 [Saccharopolyspora sp. NPDC000359]|uniref:hypothetical protein n=1 Tax=Saccharopolyspora sp. NPDC000359 TaxID=3154251 RepID=UPI0033183A78
MGGVMFLVTQYRQLVEGLSPFAARLWMGPPALMMFLASLTAPLLARRVRPGVIVAVTLVLSTAGYLLLSVVDRGDIGLVVSPTCCARRRTHPPRA